MNNAAEEKLVARAVQGDQDALGRLLETYQGRLYHVVLRMVGNRDDAVELTQEAMVKIITHIGRFDGRASISTWMTRIAMNLAISHLRKKRVRRAASLESSAWGDASPDGQAATLRQQLEDRREPSPARSVQQSEMLKHLRTAMGRLDTDLRAVLVLRDIDELDYGNIAEVLSVPLGTVKSRLFRARLALRREMYKLCPQAEDQAKPRPPVAGSDGSSSTSPRHPTPPSPQDASPGMLTDG